MTTARLHVHTAKIPVRRGGMDVLGHVNNVVCFQYFETGRMEWLLRRQLTEEGS